MSTFGPVDGKERTLREWDFFLLWAGAAISLPEIWAGGLLVSFGLAAGLAIILLGHVLGNTPMALGGLIGSRHGVPSIVSTRGALGNRGSALPALLVVLLSTLTTTFLDIYSNAVSAQSLFPKLGTRGLVLLGGAAGTLIALVFDATKYEGFLLFIGSAFCPLFGVVLTDYFILKRGRYVAEDLYRRGRYWYAGGVNWKAMGAWAAGFGIYHACAKTGFAGGASIPAMALAAAIYLAISHGERNRT